MAPRNFAITKARASVGGGVIDIPTMAVFKYHTVGELVEAFTSKWGVEPRLFTLPVTESDGLLFRVEGLADAPVSDRFPEAPDLSDFSGVVRHIAAAGYDLVLTLDPELSFLSVDNLNIRDIVNKSASQLCIGNQLTRQVAAAILGTGVDLALAATEGKSGSLMGVALDATDLWPGGGENGRVRMTCFCTACTSYFESVAPGLVAKYKTFPNPWSLLLKPSNRGMAFVSNIGPKANAEEVLGASKQQGYDVSFGSMDQAAKLDQAALLLRYMRARHDQTVASLKDVFDQALDGLTEELLTVVIVEGDQYGWTSGVWLEELDAAPRSPNNPFGEIWFDPTSEVPHLTKARYRTFMWGRSRYTITAFFQFCAKVGDSTARSITGISRYSQEELRQMILERSGRLLANAGGGQALLGLLPAPDDFQEVNTVGRVGLVGVGLDNLFMERFVGQLRIVPGQRDRSPEARSSNREPDLLAETGPLL